MSHVELDRAEMAHRRCGSETNNIAGSNSRGGLGTTGLVASHVSAVDIGHTLVALVVLRLANIDPVCGIRLSTDDESWKMIWSSIRKVRLEM